MNTQKLELLARIASLYYEQNLTQEQIAGRSGYSRSMVSRLLTEARAQGVVEVRIHHPLHRVRELEQEFLRRFELDAVRVLARGTLQPDLAIRRLGNLAAIYLEEVLPGVHRIGVSYGAALSETINALRAGVFADIEVVQMIGALELQKPDEDGPALARRLARRVGGSCHTLAAPAFAESPAARDTLMNDAHVRGVTDLAAGCDLALTGTGALDPEHSTLLRAGSCSSELLRQLSQAGAVGEVCAIPLDIDGGVLDTLLTRCLVGVQPEQFRRIPTRVGVAGGEIAAAPVLAACRSGLLNVLVVDEAAALGALRMISN